MPFRPCLRCRPELAPSSSLVNWDASATLFSSGALAGLNRRGVGQSLAARLGVSSRHLQRIKRTWGIATAVSKPVVCCGQTAAG
jgi:AraC family transcriptional regulator of adaptative response / DNA-3-methyladenine glycosylase II